MHDPTSDDPIRRFLDALYPDPLPDDAHLVLFTLHARTKKSHSDWLRSTDDAARRARVYRADRNVFYGVALQDLDAAREARRRGDHLPSPHRFRGGKTTALLLPAAWVDLDVAGPTHKSDTLPPDRDAALALLDAVPKKPSIIVATGGGFHVYWLLREPWTLADDAAREDADAWLKTIQKAVIDAAAEHGWTVDPAAELARVMRLPGTLNHKAEGTPLETGIVLFRPDRRYRPDDFAALPPVPVRARRRAPLVPRVAAEDDWRRQPPGDYDAVRDGCSYLRACYDRRAALPEPDWYAILSILGHLASAERDGRALAHAFSKDYPEYKLIETDEKLRRATTEARPRTCANIAFELGAFREHCASCVHLKRESSPVSLGWETLPRDKIAVDHRENEVADAALQSLVEREDNLFRRAGMLVQIAWSTDRPGEEPFHRPAVGVGAYPIQDPRLRELLSTHCRFKKAVAVKETKAAEKGRKTVEAVEWRPVHPPTWLARALLGRLEWPSLPPLEGLVTTPVLRADGRVLQEKGYDPPSALYHAPSIDFDPVPETPTAAQVTAALDALRDAVCDFPFESEGHLAAWLAALLTPLARFAFRGPSPLNLIDANVRGAGKSLLADVCHLLITGRVAARLSYQGDDAELRKTVTAMALQARQLVLLDNVSGGFGSPTIDLVLTATTWRDRILGRNEEVELPLLMTWFATGNNVELRGDVARRTLHVRLESPEERPETRRGFRRPQLLAWIAAERARLVPAALTLLRGYVAAGRPDQGLRAWGSYEQWSELVRGTVVWAGLADPIVTCEDLTTVADVVALAESRLVRGMAEVLPTIGGVATSSRLLEAVGLDAPGHDVVKSAFEELFPRLRRGELPTPVALSRKLRAMRNRRYDGHVLIQIPKGRDGVRWRVEDRTPRDDGDDRDALFPR